MLVRVSVGTGVLDAVGVKDGSVCVLVEIMTVIFDAGVNVGKFPDSELPVNATRYAVRYLKLPFAFPYATLLRNVLFIVFPELRQPSEKPYSPFP